MKKILVVLAAVAGLGLAKAAPILADYRPCGPTNVDAMCHSGNWDVVNYAASSARLAPVHGSVSASTRGAAVQVAVPLAPVVVAAPAAVSSPPVVVAAAMDEPDPLWLVRRVGVQ